MISLITVYAVQYLVENLVWIKKNYKWQSIYWEGVCRWSSYVLRLSFSEERWREAGEQSYLYLEELRLLNNLLALNKESAALDGENCLLGSAKIWSLVLYALANKN